jgi:hypothetical protein
MNEEQLEFGLLTEAANLTEERITCESVAPLNLDYEIAISIFANKFVSIAKSIRLTLLLLLALFGKHDVRQQKDGKLFAPAVFSGSRSNDNFISASALCMDFDHGQPRVEQILNLFPATFVIYYSTFSHCFKSTEKNRDGEKVPADLSYTPENPRFRFVIPLSRPVKSEEHALLVAGVKSVIPANVMMECLDTSCFEKSRSHYLPSCPPELAIYAFSRVQEGELLNVDKFMALGSDSEELVSKKTTKKKPSKSASAVPHSVEIKEPDSELATWASRNPDFDLIAALDIKYQRGAIRKGKQHIMCPFQCDHTDQSNDYATFIANASQPDHNAWDIHCCHAHCIDRDRIDFLTAMVNKGWLSIDSSAMAARRPSKIYYPVNDILAAPDWTALHPEERRIALDLMTFAWASNGAIADDDWQISRHLDLSEDAWLGYRQTLKRTGWLMEVEGKLTNSIVLREFEKAQNALMAFLAKSSNGGKSTQAKSRAARQPQKKSKKNAASSSASSGS